MSRARRYPVGGDPAPVPVDKPVPIKMQIVIILDSARDGVMTRSQLMVAAARLYGVEPPDQRRHEAIAWARTVIDYPATERLLDRMERDALIVGRQAWEWAEIGHRFGGAQARTTYYMTARRAQELTARHEKHRDTALWARAATLADDMLRTRHADAWARFREEAYAALQKGLPAPQSDTEEPK